ncbi:MULTISPECIES: hypothetical protein [Oerskovia]|jgi:hypothetical protein|uniref:Gram-positive cocci surface proteins LPxTG domain-containing protein n=2 Tax=Oerskovia TaxID=162491 RepID=A0ABR8V126_9CELL|nr:MULTISPECIES: hypothetical protein [Oerskovia]MBD7998372.1 hypothetical protein [Oerskovia gallyi]MBM7499122.1 hypothetical protein [Oerskovia paurometabola]
MNNPTMPAAALALLLTTVPVASQASAEGATSPTAAAVDIPTASVIDAIPDAAQDSAQATTTETESGAEQEVPDVAEVADGDTDEAPAEDSPVPTDLVDTVDPAAGEATVPTEEATETEAAPESVAQDCADCEANGDRIVVTPGYQDDGIYRPFWWEADGLHFDDQIPASGYVNINVPGAQNVSIDSHRELIGATFIPWSYFGLEPGMCIRWTESNGYDYHFGEDNSGRGGVDEKDWEFCVPSAPEPDPEPEPTPEPTPEPEPEPKPEPEPEPEQIPEPAVPAVPLAPTVLETPSFPTVTLVERPSEQATPTSLRAVEHATTAQVPTGSLATTGASTVAAALAAGAFGAGAGLVGIARRRRGR